MAEQPTGNGRAIEPNAVYDDGDIGRLTDIGGRALARARKEEGLRFTRKGGRVIYLGQWVLDWLQGSGQVRGKDNAEPV